MRGRAAFNQNGVSFSLVVYGSLSRGVTHLRGSFDYQWIVVSILSLSRYFQDRNSLQGDEKERQEHGNENDRELLARQDVGQVGTGLALFLFALDDARATVDIIIVHDPFCRVVE